MKTINSFTACAWYLRTVAAGCLCCLSMAWCAEAARAADPPPDIREIRAKMQQEFHEALNELRPFGNDPKLYDKDGFLNEDHPAVKRYKTRKQEILKSYNKYNTNYDRFVEACKAAGVEQFIKNSGGIPKTINSDLDFSELKPGEAKKVVDALEKAGYTVERMADRFVIREMDNSVWKTMFREKVGSVAHQAQEAMLAGSEDIFSTHGGKCRTSNGEVGYKDSVGEVLANAKKMSEASHIRPDSKFAEVLRPDLPTDVQKVNTHIVGKSGSKIHEWLQTSMDPVLAKQSKITQGHGSIEDGAIVKVNDAPEVKAAKIKEFVNKQYDHVGEAMKTAREVSAGQAMRRAEAAKLLHEAGYTETARNIMEKQIKVNVSNEEAMRYLARTDPKMAAKAAGLPVRVNADGTLLNTQTGRTMSGSQLEEAVLKVTRDTTAEAMHKAAQRGARSTFMEKAMGGAARIILVAGAVDGAYRGAEKAVAEEKPGDDWRTLGKAIGYGIAYTTGIPDVITESDKAGKEAVEEFKKELKAGGNPYLWASALTLEAIGKTCIAIGKGMIVAPIARGWEAVKEFKGAAQEYPTAVWADQQAKETLKNIISVREQKAREREGQEARDARLILAENWVRMRDVPLVVGYTSADNENLKRTNPDEYKYRLANVLVQYDQLAEQLRRDGVLSGGKQLIRKQVFNLLWTKRRGTAKEFQQALADHFKFYGKKYAVVPEPQELAGKWSGGELRVRSTAFGKNSGCGPEGERQLRALENAPLPLSFDMKPNPDGTGLMQLNISPPRQVDAQLAEQMSKQRIPPIPYRYQDGKIVGEIEEQGAKLKVSGEFVRSGDGWTFKGDWQISAVNGGQTAALLKGDLTGAK